MKNTLPLFFLLLTAVFFCVSCRAAPPSSGGAEPEDDRGILSMEDIDAAIELPPPGEALPVSVFPEVWAYVVAGREAALTRGLPITDIGYFSADIDSYGALIDIPDRRKLPAFSGRVHLVVKCDSRSLSHFVLMPGSAERKALIAALLSAARPYDGLQVDFENIPQRDGDAFFSFLAELKAGMGHNKMFTVALPARLRKLSEDVYDYEKIAPVVDRILVMAYDEHWSTSVPGPIASLTWCKRVANYSMGVIGREKLIMGLPFYGRAWGSANPSRAHVYSGIEDIIKENSITGIQRENGIPTFDYSVTIPVKVYYEDEYSISTRMEMYRAMNIDKIGFWRLGQETQAVWKLLQLGK